MTSLIRELEAQQFQLEEQQLATSLHEKFDSDDQYTNSGAVVPSVREIQEHRTCLSELFHLIQCSTILAVQLVKTEKSLGIALRTTHFGIEPNLLTLLTVKTILEESVAEQAGLAPGDMVSLLHIVFTDVGGGIFFFFFYFSKSSVFLEFFYFYGNVLLYVYFHCT